MLTKHYLEKTQTGRTGLYPSRATSSYCNLWSLAGIGIQQFGNHSKEKKHVSLLTRLMLKSVNKCNADVCYA